VPYSIIAFHGIINENAAKRTGLTDEECGFAGRCNVERYKKSYNPLENRTYAKTDA